MATFNSPSDSSFKPKDMELIYSELLTSQQNSFDTGTLKTGFRGLLIHARVRGDASNNFSTMSIFFNGDLNGSNYQTTRLLHSNGSVAAQAYDTGFAGSIPMQASTQPRFATTTIHIVGHESAIGYKGWTAYTQSIANPSNLGLYAGGGFAGMWENTDPITSIKYRVFDPQYNLVAGSSFAVYGLK